MHAQIHTTVFRGIETIAVTVQIHIANAHIGIDQQIMMDAAAQDLLRTAMDQASLSACAYLTIMRVSRTITDLVGDGRVCRAALAEALPYRAMPLLA